MLPYVLFACQTPAVSDRLNELGYPAEIWDRIGDAEHRDVIFVPHHNDREALLAARGHATRVMRAAKAVSVRRLEYPDADDLPDGYSLDQEPSEDVIHLSLRDAMRAPAKWQRERRLIDMGVGRFAEEPPEQQWAAGHLIPARAPVLLAGRGGIGKTRAALHLALLMAAWDGEGPAPEWMGQRVRKHGVSVVISYEEHTESAWRILRRMADAEGIDLDRVDARFKFKSMQDRDASGQALVAPDPATHAPAATEEYFKLIEQLMELKEKVGDIACIVIDNVGTAFKVNGNDYQEVNSAAYWMQRWASEFGALVLNIGHTNKGATPQRGRNGSPGQPLTDEEVLNSVMGSTGWVSAHRATMVMWQMQEQQEKALAEALGEDYREGETRRRYIHAQILKENVEGIYTGRLTLRRNGTSLDNLGTDPRGAMARSVEQSISALADAIGEAVARGTVITKTGKLNGVHAMRAALGKPFSTMQRAALVDLVERGLDLGMIGEGKVGGKRALIDARMEGDDRYHGELAARAVQIAFDNRRPFAVDPESPDHPSARLDELPSRLAQAGGKAVARAFSHAVMKREVGRQTKGEWAGHFVPKDAYIP